MIFHVLNIVIGVTASIRNNVEHREIVLEKSLKNLSTPPILKNEIIENLFPKIKGLLIFSVTYLRRYIF